MSEILGSLAGLFGKEGVEKGICGCIPVFQLDRGDHRLELEEFSHEIERHVDNGALSDLVESGIPRTLRVEEVIGVLKVVFKETDGLDTSQALVSQVVTDPNGQFPHRVDVGLELEAFMEDQLVVEFLVMHRGWALLEGFRLQPLVRLIQPPP